MTEKLTWAEFAEKYQPKDDDNFLDDRKQQSLGLTEAMKFLNRL